MHKIFLTIADILIEIHSPLTAAELGIEERLGSFIGAAENRVERIVLTWECSQTTPQPRGELIFDPGSIWKMFYDGEHYYAYFTYNDSVTPPHTQGILRANPTWDDLNLTEQQISPAWISLLNTGAGELTLRTKIILTDGLVFHASALDDNGHGIVFIGHSGAGKSTQVNLWVNESGVIVMSDDRIAVRPNANGAACYSTPWGGSADFACNHDAPLAALILVEQAPQNEIQQLTPATAAPLLLACTFLPFWDKELMQRAIANLDMLLARVPVYCLRCRPEATVIPLVRSMF